MMQSAQSLIAADRVVLRTLGRASYASTFTAMQEFTRARAPHTPDELWLLEHAPVYTMGLKGRGGTRTDIDGIPLVYTDRGGDVTYHGPGQVVVYVLVDLPRRGLGLKSLVFVLEQTVIDLMAEFHIQGGRRAGAPGVYVDDSKIAALGLRIKRGCSYHGLALNVDMDLAPFSRIDPCGYKGQPVTQLADLGVTAGAPEIGRRLLRKLAERLGYTGARSIQDGGTPRR